MNELAQDMRHTVARSASRPRWAANAMITSEIKVDVMLLIFRRDCGFEVLGFGGLGVWSWGALLGLDLGFESKIGMFGTFGGWEVLLTWAVLGRNSSTNDWSFPNRFRMRPTGFCKPKKRNWVKPYAIAHYDNCLYLALLCRTLELSCLGRDCACAD